jgi:Synergist-CTERM protein sorting domain-containing protein
VEDILVPGRIIDCLNKADVTGGSYVGGIAGSFLGEMYRCGNEGTIKGAEYFGGLLATGSNVRLDSALPERRLIVSDCYNAGEVICTNTALTNYFAALIGSDTHASFMNEWRTDDGTFEDFKVSNVFSYGGITHATLDAEHLPMIAGLVTAADDISFHPYDITQIFANTYYRLSIGGRLFVADNLNGTDGLGTGLVKTVIKGKTEAEFASANMAALLNNGRTDAPWEFVDGNDYPTLRTSYTPLETETPYTPVYDSGGGGGCDTGAAGMAVLALAAALVLTRKRRKG